MPTFKKITEPEMDHLAVNLALKGSAIWVHGRMIPPVSFRTGIDRDGAELCTHWTEWMSAADAVEKATEAALSHKTHVNVLDPENLWLNEWGYLEGRF